MFATNPVCVKQKPEKEHFLIVLLYLLQLQLLHCFQRLIRIEKNLFLYRRVPLYTLQ